VLRLVRQVNCGVGFVSNEGENFYEN